MSETGPGATRRVERTIDPAHPAFAGHFPGAPLLPGVALLAEVLEAIRADDVLGASLGATPQIANAKFLAPVLPGARLTIELAPASRGVRFTVRCSQPGDEARIAASGVIEPAPADRPADGAST